MQWLKICIEESVKEIFDIKKESMFFVFILLMPFWLVSVDKVIQEKLEYRNLFDTCINNKNLFYDMRDENDVNIYIDSLNSGSQLLRKSFKEFIKRNENEVLTYGHFRQFKALVDAYALQITDNSPLVFLDHSNWHNLLFGSAFKEALRKEQKLTLLEWLTEICPKEPTGTIRATLGAMLFSHDDVYKKIEALSGGETARLLFAKVMLDKRNVIVLDEPTNHLDIDARNGLAEALNEYKGTVICVSHDRYFLAKIANRIIALTEKGIQDYKGTYQEFVQYYGIDYFDK